MAIRKYPMKPVPSNAEQVRLWRNSGMNSITVIRLLSEAIALYGAATSQPAQIAATRGLTDALQVLQMGFGRVPPALWRHLVRR